MGQLDTSVGTGMRRLTSSAARRLLKPMANHHTSSTGMPQLGVSTWSLLGAYGQPLKCLAGASHLNWRMRHFTSLRKILANRLRCRSAMQSGHQDHFDIDD